MSRRFFRYLEKVYKFSQKGQALQDRRQGARVSTWSCFLFGFWMFALASQSLNGFETKLRQENRRRLWQRVFGSRAPSADTVGYCLKSLELEGLRRLIHQLYTTLQRNHQLRKFLLGSYRALSLDGHELFASYRRHCSRCSVRVVHTKKGDRFQYYHPVVVAQMVGGPLPLPLDLEEIRPGEAELFASLRLLKRMLRNYPKAFDLVTGDALYANPEFLKILIHHHKHLIATLKQNHPDLLKDAKALFLGEEPVISTQGNKQLARWDLEGFTTWPQATETIRIVRSYETKITGTKSENSDWFWITTLSQKQASTETICQIGHARWEIENQGFNYLVNHFAFDHCFHHHPNAILAFCLINFIAYILLHSFHLFNLKPQLRIKLHLLALIQELASAFWTDLQTLNPETRAPPIY